MATVIVSALVESSSISLTTSPLGNSSDVPADPSCIRWILPQHGVFQIGCFCVLNGFLVPANAGVYQSLWLRCMLCIGFFCSIFSAGPINCWPDVLGWSLVFFIINVCQVIYLYYNVMPVKFEEDMQATYNALFKPFNITPQQFKRLVDTNGELYELDATGHYAIEGKTPVDEKLSLLISGRMRVTSERVFLHSVDSNQFLDSPEWESCTPGAGDTFQVTITAVEKCRYVQWSRRTLRNFLQKEPFLKAVFEAIVGKDITTKLYSLNSDSGHQLPSADIIEEPATETTDTEDKEDRERKADFQHQWRPVKDDDSDIESLPSPCSHRSSTPSMHSCLSMVDIRANIASGKGAGGPGLVTRLDSVGSNYPESTNDKNKLKSISE